MISTEQVNKSNEEEIKKLYKLSLKSLGEIPQLYEPSFEQEQWLNRKMKSWRCS